MVIDSHVMEAIELEVSPQIIRTKIIDDKIIINRRIQQIIIEYRIGNINEDGEFVDEEERSVSYRDEEYEQKLAELFNNEKLFFANVRGQGKQAMNKKEDKIRGR